MPTGEDGGALVVAGNAAAGSAIGARGSAAAIGACGAAGGVQPAGGSNAFLTSAVAVDILDPVMANFFNAACDKAMFGWPCDPTIEKMRDQFGKESDPDKQKQIAIDLQKYWVDHPTHVHLGQWYRPTALRANVDGMMAAPVTVFWNMTKK